MRPWPRHARPIRAGLIQLMDDITQDGRDLIVTTNGEDWRVGWYPPPDPPPGTPHGAAAVCVIGDQVVLVSSDGQRWGLPGGRPEPRERWIDTLQREVGEEACAVVERARLLGFTRGICVRGPQEGRVDCAHRSSAAAALASRSLVLMTVPPELTGLDGLEPQVASGPNRRKKS